MNKHAILIAICFTIFLDFFNLGLIYPIFSSIIFEDSGHLISPAASPFQRTSLFGCLISAFPFGQFLGAPIIGQLSDHYGRRHLLILSLIGTIASLSICAFSVLFSNPWILLLSRFVGGLMAGNMTLAYASLADFSSQEEKVKNFSLVPLATGLGFALGPYSAGILANPQIFPWAGPAIPFALAVLFSLINLLLVIWKFPKTSTYQKQRKILRYGFSSISRLAKALQERSLRSYLWILFLMISSNLVFVQFAAPFTIERFHINVTEVGYLYANMGLSIALGHLFLTRWLTRYLLPEKALAGSLICLTTLLMVFLYSYNLMMLHLLTVAIMLACAVAYTNSMALISNQATKERQGEIMGLAVSIQSCSEFLPAAVLGLMAFVSQTIPLFTAGVCALCSYLILLHKTSLHLQRNKSLNHR